MATSWSRSCLGRAARRVQDRHFVECVTSGGVSADRRRQRAGGGRSARGGGAVAEVGPSRASRGAADQRARFVRSVGSVNGHGPGSWSLPDRKARPAKAKPLSLTARRSRRPMTATVPFTDLLAMTREVRADVYEAWDGLLQSGRFIGGEAVEEFEQAWAAYCRAQHAIGVGERDRCPAARPRWRSASARETR